MGLRSALAMFRSVQAVPPDAPRPSMTIWRDQTGVLPPVSWAPVTGEFETHWDWVLTDAMSIPGYWRARLLISSSIGALPIKAWRGSDELTLPAVLAEPQPGEDRITTVSAWVGDLLDHGNALAYVTSWSAEGRPTALRPWPCTDVSVGRDPASGSLVYVFYDSGRPAFTRSSAEVFHARGPLPYPGALRGIGVLEAGLANIARIGAESRYAANAFASGVPSGLLRVRDPDLQPGSPDDPADFTTAQGIKKSWLKSVSAGGIAVLSDLVDFTPLSWTPTDAQLVEARQFSLVDVANMFNLDPYWVGASQVSAPYQNVQQSAVQLTRFCLNYWICVMEAQLSRLLARGQDARFNRDALLREPLADRVDSYVKLLDAGIVSVNYVRALEGLPPVPGGDAVGAVAPASPPGDNVSPLFPASGDTSTNQAATGG